MTMAVPFLAPSLVAFRNELNARYPNRDKASDGWIGDAAHSSRESDHNPDDDGMVHALDLDEDTDGNTADSGPELEWLSEHLRNSRDPRIKYVIYEGRIFAGRNGPSPWVWRPYVGGSNLHTKHMHTSVTYDEVGENSTAPWLPQDAAPIPEDDDDMWLHASRFTGVHLVDGGEVTWISDQATVNELAFQGVRIYRMDANEQDARYFINTRGAQIDEELLASEKAQEAYLAAIKVSGGGDGLSADEVEDVVRDVFADAGQE